MDSPEGIVSVVVRSKNEARWILSCLRAVRNQITKLKIELSLSIIIQRTVQSISFISR